MKKYPTDKIIKLARNEAVELDETAAGRLAAYTEILAKWSRKVNLIGPGAKERFWEEHLTESLIFGSRIIDWPKSKDVHLADIGSGAGLPGLIIGTLKPDIPISLIESRQKKASFLEIATREMDLHNIEVEGNRVPTKETESLKGKFDLVFSRAADQVEGIIKTAEWLSTKNGEIWLLIGPTAIERAIIQAEKMGLEARIIKDETSFGKKVICIKIKR